MTSLIFASTFAGPKINTATYTLAARIYTEDSEVDNRLMELFGVTRQDLLGVVHAVVGARAEAVGDDPISAAGLFAYIYGTRHLRALFKRKKWTVRREQNVEAVQHPTLQLQIVYQSVDIAASDLHSPRAISGKGSGADRMICSAQGMLFSREQLETRGTLRLKPVTSGVWFFCVSVDGEEVRAELSLPSAIEGGNFQGFLERIYILSGDDWNAVQSTPNTGDVVEFEPVVTRRK